MKYIYFDEKKQHLHTLDGKPLLGTSTIVNVLNKPLTWWASGMAVGHLGWTNSKFFSKEERLEKAGQALSWIKDMDSETYLSLLDKAYQAHNEKKETSAEAGTDMHELLENYVKECISKNQIIPIDSDDYVGKFSKWAVLNIEKFTYSEINCFSKKMWTGGISDVGAVMKDGKKVIIDFKSSKEAYHSQFIQCAGYDLQISENGGFTADGKKIMKAVKADGYWIIPFGAKEFEPVFRGNTDQLRQCFKACLELYKLTNN